MLILFLGSDTIWLWVVLLTFQRYILPPFSGSKCVVCIDTAHTSLFFFKGMVEGGVEWGLVPSVSQ
jgi:hypothetical protein